MNEFGLRLLNAMDYRNFAQRGLAEEVGVDRKRVNDWVNGRCLPDLWNFRALVKALGVTADYLLFGKIREDGE